MNSIIEKRQKEYIEKIKELRIIDDDFMKVVFKDKDCVNYIIEEILQNDYQNIIDSNVEYDLKNLCGRSHRIDILATDSSKRKINVEFQKDRQGADIKRARRHISAIDIETSNEKEKFHQLKDIKTIFITENDELGNGLPISHIHRYIDETNSQINDGTEIIYVPINIRDGSSLDLLKEDLLEKEPDKIHSEVLRKRVKYLKENEEGERIMCKIFEEVRSEGYIEGKNDGIETVIKIMLLENEPFEKIKKYTGSSIERIMDIKNNMIYA